jgi:hypothetical protein
VYACVVCGLGLTDDGGTNSKRRCRRLRTTATAAPTTTVYVMSRTQAHRPNDAAYLPLYTHAHRTQRTGRKRALADPTEPDLKRGRV